MSKIADEFRSSELGIERKMWDSNTEDALNKFRTEVETWLDNYESNFERQYKELNLNYESLENEFNELNSKYELAAAAINHRDQQITKLEKIIVKLSEKLVLE